MSVINLIMIVLNIKQRILYILVGHTLACAIKICYSSAIDAKVGLQAIYFINYSCRRKQNIKLNKYAAIDVKKLIANTKKNFM